MSQGVDMNVFDDPIRENHPIIRPLLLHAILLSRISRKKTIPTENAFQISKTCLVSCSNSTGKTPIVSKRSITDYR